MEPNRKKPPSSKVDRHGSEVEELLQRGLEPTMVDNLEQMQKEYQKSGIEMTLEEVYAFEVEAEDENEQGEQCRGNQ